MLLIDHYDSFTYNLHHLISQVSGKSVAVVRSDDPRVDEMVERAERIVLSPGPGRPDQAPTFLRVIAHAKQPILGICLGMQAIAHAFGARIVRATEVVHGKSRIIEHRGRKLFAKIPSPIAVGRYHSLIVDRKTIPDCLKIDAESLQGEVMALSHAELPIFGVQFHPESILTSIGETVVRNFLAA